MIYNPGDNLLRVIPCFLCKAVSGKSMNFGPLKRAISKIFATFAKIVQNNYKESITTNHKLNYYGFTYYRPPIGAPQTEHHAQQGDLYNEIQGVAPGDFHAHGI